MMKIDKEIPQQNYITFKPPYPQYITIIPTSPQLFFCFDFTCKFR